MITGIHTILVQSSDMDRSVAFYRDVLELVPGYASPYWSEFSLGSQRLGIHPVMGSGPMGRPMTGSIVGVATLDILSLWTRLKAAGTWVSDSLHDTPSGVVLDFCDPDGACFQAIQVGVKAADLGQAADNA